MDINFNYCRTLFLYKIKNILIIGFISLTSCANTNYNVEVTDLSHKSSDFMKSVAIHSSNKNLENSYRLEKINKITPETKTYTIELGDTLYAIAWLAQKDIRDIAKWNNLKKPYIINAGQMLYLHNPNNKETLKKPINITSSKNKPPKSEKLSEKEQKKTTSSIARNSTSNYDRNASPKATNSYPKQIKKWIWPVRGQISAKFSAKSQGNKGIDIQGKLGKDIKAAAAGKVMYSGSELRGYGNLIIVKHNTDFLSAYAHTKDVIVKKGQWVNAGEKIAAMGNTGTDSTKLHFIIRYKGEPVNPEKYLP